MFQYLVFLRWREYVLWRVTDIRELFITKFNKYFWWIFKKSLQNLWSLCKQLFICVSSKKDNINCYFFLSTCNFLMNRANSNRIKPRNFKRRSNKNMYQKGIIKIICMYYVFSYPYRWISNCYLFGHFDGICYGGWCCNHDIHW